MSTGRLTRYGERTRETLRAAFTTDLPPRLVAGSFALGMFLMSLPNLGAAVPVIGWIAYRFERANELAMLASVAVMNPVMKSGVYVASFLVGTTLLGPVPDTTRADVGLAAGDDVFVRLLLGNAILAVVFALIAYAVAYRTVRTYRRRAA